MTKKIILIFRYITIISLFIFSVISCETDFDTVGKNLVDNGAFDVKDTIFNITAYTKDIEKSGVDNLNTNELQSLSIPLGVFDSPNFGLFESSVISQLSVPSTLDWENAILNAVYLEIPYSSESIRELEDTKPKFELTNIIGDKNTSFKLKVSRLDTYLNKLDPQDPSIANKYYSDKVYNTSDELYPETEFKPSENDTVMYYNRVLMNSIGGDIVVQDTIKLTDSKPFIRIPLDIDFFKTNFIENGTQSLFENNNDFQEFFNGIVIEATGDDGSVMMLDYSTAKVSLYLSSEDTEKKTEYAMNADLNADGNIDTESTTEYDVREKLVVAFPLAGVRTNHFERNDNMDLENALTNSDTTNGEKKLYVQGAAGSIAVIDLFKDVNLDEIRAKNWLINEANLTVYIDGQSDLDTLNIPNRLLLYKLDTNLDDVNEDAQILDAMIDANLFDGYLRTDDENPQKYKINITNYITEILKKEDAKNPTKLGLKVFNGLDIPSTLTANDTLVSNYSWNPQGVVLYGNKYTETDVDFDKRIKLEVYYTELKK